MTLPLYTFQQKTPTQIRDDYLRTLKNGLINIGIANPNVGPNSPEYAKATALANELAVCQAGIVISADNEMPDTAQGAGLDRWLTIFGLSRRQAVPSSGVVTVTISNAGGTNIVAGAQLVDSSGLRYAVTTGGIYQNGAQVPVTAVDAGAATNHANGDVLRWSSSTPAFCAPTVTVGPLGGTAGLSGGADSEVGNDEPPRARLLALLGTPPKDSTWSMVASLAAASSSTVGLASVYPALQGPGTVFVAVSATPQTSAPLTSTSKSRAVPSTTVNSTIAPYVQGSLPEHAYCQVYSTVDVPVNLAIQLALPSAGTASPPGPGGGWIDGTPWPPSIGGVLSTGTVGTAPVQVTFVAGPTSFTVNATTPPNVGYSHIAVLSPTNWQLYTANVIGYSGTSGAYSIQVDTPIPPIAQGMAVFPQSVNQQTYVSALFASFGLMGPGEWTSNASVLARAYRHPATATSNPSSLTASFLKPIISSGPEVADAEWIGRYTASGTGLGSAITSPWQPAVAASFTVGPNIFTPNFIGFYQI